jgi:hypothetical protein
VSAVSLVAGLGGGGVVHSPSPACVGVGRRSRMFSLMAVVLQLLFYVGQIVTMFTLNSLSFPNMKHIRHDIKKKKLE